MLRSYKSSIHIKVMDTQKIQPSMSQSAKKYKGHKLNPRYKRLTILDLIDITTGYVRIKKVRDMIRSIKIKALGTSSTTSASVRDMKSLIPLLRKSNPLSKAPQSRAAFADRSKISVMSSCDWGWARAITCL